MNTAVGTRACCIVLETVEKRSLYARNACIYQETLNDVYSTTYTPLVIISTTYTTNFMSGLRQTLRGSSGLRQTRGAKRHVAVCFSQVAAGLAGYDPSNRAVGGQDRTSSRVFEVLRALQTLR